MNKLKEINALTLEGKIMDDDWVNSEIHWLIKLKKLYLCSLSSISIKRY